MDTRARSINPRRVGAAIELAEALVDMRETDILRLLLDVDAGVTDQLAMALAARGSGPSPEPPRGPWLRSVVS